MSTSPPPPFPLGIPISPPLQRHLLHYSSPDLMIAPRLPPPPLAPRSPLSPPPPSPSQTLQNYSWNISRSQIHPLWPLLTKPLAAIVAGGLGGILCFLLTHEILSTRQYMLAGLKKVRDTDRRELTAVPSPVPTHLLTTLE